MTTATDNFDGVSSSGSASAANWTDRGDLEDTATGPASIVINSGETQTDYLSFFHDSPSTTDWADIPDSATINTLTFTFEGKKTGTNSSSNTLRFRVGVFAGAGIQVKSTFAAIADETFVEYSLAASPGIWGWSGNNKADFKTIYLWGYGDGTTWTSDWTVQVQNVTFTVDYTEASGKNGAIVATLI